MGGCRVVYCPDYHTCQTHQWEGSLDGCTVIYSPDTTHVRPTTGKDHWVDAQLSTALTPHMSDPPLGRITGWMHSYLQPWHHTCQTLHRGRDHWVDGELFTALTPHMSDPPLGGITGWMQCCLLAWHCTCQTHHLEGSRGGCGVVYCPDTENVRPTRRRCRWDGWVFQSVLTNGSTDGLRH